MVGSSMGPSTHKLRLLIYRHPTLDVRRSTRPEVPICLGFQENIRIWHKELRLEDISRHIVDGNFIFYFRTELEAIKLDGNLIKTLVEKLAVFSSGQQ